MNTFKNICSLALVAAVLSVPAGLRAAEAPKLAEAAKPAEAKPVTEAPKPAAEAAKPADAPVAGAGTTEPAKPGKTPAAAGSAPVPGAESAVPADATAGVVGTVPVAAAEEAFRYDASLPDPFVPYSEPILVCPTPGEPLAPGTVVPEECGEEIKEPLELFELNELQVLGIIWGIRDARAKIKDPEGNFWTVRTGQKIGKNRGRIKAIREGEIEVEERFWDEGLRAYQKTTATMTMSKD